MATFGNRDIDDRNAACRDPDIDPAPRRSGLSSGTSAGILLAVLLLLGLVFWSSSNRPTQSVDPAPAATSSQRTGAPNASPGTSSANPAPAPAPAVPSPPATPAPSGQ